MIRKFIFLLAWLGILILSILGIVYVVVPRYFVQFNFEVGSFKFNMTILTISIVYIIICILKFLSLFKRKEDYTIKTQDGVVRISYNSITTYVRGILATDRDISNLKIHAFKRNRKLNVAIQCDLLTDECLTDKSSSIQNEIKTKLADKLKIEIGNVEVKVSKLATKSQGDV